jgi:hypothetical protein
MHPAKGMIPQESEFRFVREFMAFAALDKWFEATSVVVSVDSQ